MGVCGYLAVSWRCLAVLTLRLMFALPAGLPVRSQGDSQSDNKVMDNITVRQGETVFLTCPQVEAVTHTAWLNRSSILYAGEDKWSVDPRVALVTYSPEEFTIRIDGVEVTDEGPYLCAIQTSRNPRTLSVHVLVQVPPKIINLSKDLVVNEGADVTLMCQANGKPEPSVSWKLLSPSGDVSTEEEVLEIPSITRQSAGTYECTAVNDVAVDAQTVDITVNYAPAVSEGRDVGVTLGGRGVLECAADAMPEPDFEWYRDDRRIYTGLDGMEIEDGGKGSRLTFFNVTEADYGNFTCVATNQLGSSNTSFLLYEVIEPTSSTLLQGPRAVLDGKNGAPGLHTLPCSSGLLLLLLLVLVPLLLRF